MSKVRIELKPGEAMKISVEGAPGGDCRVASGPYLDVLKGKVVSDTPTVEAQQPSRIGINQSQQIGH